jgi:hypothetical protein
MRVGREPDRKRRCGYPGRVGDRAEARCWCPEIEFRWRAPHGRMRRYRARAVAPAWTVVTTPTMLKTTDTIRALIAILLNGTNSRRHVPANRRNGTKPERRRVLQRLLVEEEDKVGARLSYRWGVQLASGRAPPDR